MQPISHKTPACQFTPHPESTKPSFPSFLGEQEKEQAKGTFMGGPFATFLFNVEIGLTGGTPSQQHELLLSSLEKLKQAESLDNGNQIVTICYEIGSIYYQLSTLLKEENDIKLDNKAEKATQYHAKAIELFTQAAEQGYSRACRVLGEMYVSGTCVEKDDEKAIVHFRKAATLGKTLGDDIPAVYKLGQLFNQYANQERQGYYEGLPYREAARQCFHYAWAKGYPKV